MEEGSLTVAADAVRGPRGRLQAKRPRQHQGLKQNSTKSDGNNARVRSIPVCQSCDVPTVPNTSPLNFPVVPSSLDITVVLADIDSTSGTLAQSATSTSRLGSVNGSSLDISLVLPDNCIVAVGQSSTLATTKTSVEAAPRKRGRTKKIGSAQKIVLKALVKKRKRGRPKKRKRGRPKKLQSTLSNESDVVEDTVEELEPDVPEVIPIAAVEEPEVPEVIPIAAVEEPEVPEVIPIAAVEEPEVPEVIPIAAVEEPEVPEVIPKKRARRISKASTLDVIPEVPSPASDLSSLFGHLSVKATSAELISDVPSETSGLSLETTEVGIEPEIDSKNMKMGRSRNLRERSAHSSDLEPAISKPQKRVVTQRSTTSSRETEWIENAPDPAVIVTRLDPDPYSDLCIREHSSSSEASDILHGKKRKRRPSVVKKPAPIRTKKTAPIRAKKRGDRKRPNASKNKLSNNIVNSSRVPSDDEQSSSSSVRARRWRDNSPTRFTDAEEERPLSEVQKSMERKKKKILRKKISPARRLICSSESSSSAESEDDGCERVLFSKKLASSSPSSCDDAANIVPVAWPPSDCIKPPYDSLVAGIVETKTKAPSLPLTNNLCHDSSANIAVETNQETILNSSHESLSTLMKANESLFSKTNVLSDNDNSIKVSLPVDMLKTFVADTAINKSSFLDSTINGMSLPINSLFICDKVDAVLAMFSDNKTVREPLNQCDIQTSSSSSSNSSSSTSSSSNDVSVDSSSGSSSTSSSCSDDESDVKSPLKASQAEILNIAYGDVTAASVGSEVELLSETNLIDAAVNIEQNDWEKDYLEAEKAVNAIVNVEWTEEEREDYLEAEKDDYSIVDIDRTEEEREDCLEAEKDMDVCVNIGQQTEEEREDNLEAEKDIDAEQQTEEEREDNLEAEKDIDACVNTNSSDEEHYVEAVIGKKWMEKTWFYLIKWMGESKDRCTWEPVYSLTCFDHIEAFEKDIRMPPPAAAYAVCDLSGLVGFARNLACEKILGGACFSGKQYFLVKWQGLNCPDFVLAEEVTAKVPDKVSSFLLERIVQEEYAKIDLLYPDDADDRTIASEEEKNEAIGDSPLKDDNVCTVAMADSLIEINNNLKCNETNNDEAVVSDVDDLCPEILQSRVAVAKDLSISDLCKADVVDDKEMTCDEEEKVEGENKSSVSECNVNNKKPLADGYETSLDYDFSEEDFLEAYIDENDYKFDED